MFSHQLAEQAASHQETRAVRRGVVLESDLAAVPGELLGGGLAHAHVALDGGVDDLRQHVLVGEAHHQAVLGRVVLVLVLADQPLPRPVVGLALAPAAKLDLVALEVRLRLLDLDERLWRPRFFCFGTGGEGGIVSVAATPLDRRGETSKVEMWASTAVGVHISIWCNRVGN